MFEHSSADVADYVEVTVSRRKAAHHGMVVVGVAGVGRAVAATRVERTALVDDGVTIKGINGAEENTEVFVVMVMVMVWLWGVFAKNRMPILQCEAKLVGINQSLANRKRSQRCSSREQSSAQSRSLWKCFCR